MSALMTAIKAFFRRFRVIIIGTVLVVLIAVGGSYAWKQYQYRQSPQYAMTCFINALQSAQVGTLATLVDFRSLSLDFAKAIYAVRPQTPKPDKQMENAVFLFSGEIQKQLHTVLSNVPKDPPKEEKDINAPLVPVPADIALQIAQSLTLHSHDGNIAVLQAEVRHPRAAHATQLLLLMEKRGGGWTITKIVNAKELVKYFNATEKHIHDQRQAALAEKNRLEQVRMNAQLNVRSCTASVHKLSDNKTVLLVMEIIGMNKGPNVIHNLNLTATLNAANKEYKERVNMAQKLPPGEYFRYTWRKEFDVSDAAMAPVLNTPTLQCSAIPSAMTLSNGKVLYLREK